MEPSLPTRGQLERNLSQGIEALYANELGHRPTKVTCHIFGEQITVVLEQAITPPEQLLNNSGQENLAEQVRIDLDKALQPKLSALIEEVTGIAVKDVLSDAKLETGRQGIIAILSGVPKTREPAGKTQTKNSATAGTHHHNDRS